MYNAKIACSQCLLKAWEGEGEGHRGLRGGDDLWLVLWKKVCRQSDGAQCLGYSNQENERSRNAIGFANSS